MKKINFDKIKKKNLEKEEKYKIKKKTKINKDETSKKEKKKKKFRIGYYLLICIVCFALLCFIGGIGFCVYIVKSAPEYDIDKMFEKEASKLYDKDGKLFATLGVEQRQKVTYDELPEVLVDAIIATEDSRFFQHNGFDAPRFLKASISQVLGQGGGGASTLTMQLSKLAFTSTESTGIQGIIRKFTDIYMAVFKMEKNLTKEEIIEYYVNTPCLGGNIYGVQQAAEHYFGKNVKDLNLVEAAQIAGMFQSPNGYNPYYYPEDANDRKNTVLYLMHRHGYIGDDEYSAAKKVDVASLLSDDDATTSNEYQGFIDTVVQEVIDRTGNNPYDVPMEVYTTMDMSRQDAINNFYKTYKFKDSKIEVGIALVDSSNGELAAVGAGRYKTSAMTLNVATFSGQIERMAGSTMKPILDYGPAFEYAGLSTYGPFVDEPTSYGGSHMNNYNYKNKGFTNTKYCLVESVNTCALQAFRMTSNDQKKKFGESLGLDLSEVDVIPDSYSIGAWNGMTPVKLAAAYAAFSNGGYYEEPHSIRKVVYTGSDEEFEVQTERKRVMSPQTAYLTTTILYGVTPSTVKVSGTNVATKSGTSSYDYSILKKYKLSENVIPDSWAAFYSPDYAAAIWLGYVDTLNDEAVKNQWYIYMGNASTQRQKIEGIIANSVFKKNSKFKNPGGIVSVEVEEETIPAKLPSPYTPENMRNTYQFIAGTEPAETSTRYAKLSDPTNVTYTLNNNKLDLSWASPGIPSAIDEVYLSKYFKDNWGEWADKYYNKRIEYNAKNIGSFGFDIYLTLGASSEYVGWTDNTSYSIDLSKYSGSYDGVIIKSAYSIFKANESSGYKLLVEADEKPSTPEENIPVADFNDSDVVLNMGCSSQMINLGNSYTPIKQACINSIKVKGIDVTNNITNFSVEMQSVTRDGATSSEPEIKTKTGTYVATYIVSFVYGGKTITRTVNQTIIVK